MPMNLQSHDNGLKLCGGWGGGGVTVNFFLKKKFILKGIHFIEHNHRVLEILNNRKMLTYMLCSNLN